MLGVEWINHDPLTISSTQVRVFQLLESIVCQTSSHQENCKCNTMKGIYGPRLFKCNRFGCLLFRSGFESAKDRDLHLRTHDRPYRCDRPKCEFGQIGFSSQTRLNAHMKQHQANESTLQLPLFNITDCDDMEIFLLDAVEANNLDVIRKSASEVPSFAEQLIRKALQYGSRQMLESLLAACSSLRVAELCVLPWAVEANNLEAAQILLDQGHPVRQMKDDMKCMYLAISRCLPDMIEILLPYDPKDTSTSARKKNLCAMIPMESGAELEARIIKCLDLLKKWPRDRHQFPDCLKINAQRGCSIAIAKFLLKTGVHVDHRGASSSGATALYLASGRKNQRAAEMMKFLWESGADPGKTPSGGRTRMSNRPGPANISKWFGVSWEQLVNESQKVYAESKQEAASS